MNDDLGLFNDPEAKDERGGRGAKAALASRLKGKRKRTAVMWTAVALVLAVGGGGAYYGYRTLSGIGSWEDYSGAGDTDAIVEVKDGDPVSAIATTLKEQGVVASARAFTEASKNDARVTGIQPGFYLLKTNMSGANAVTMMVDPKSKIVPLEVRGGFVLHDITQPGGSVTKGVFTLIAEASCVEIDGQKKCVTSDEVRDAAENADPASLGVPEWAMADFTKVNKARRLEGLIVPGLYHLKPNVPAAELLRDVITTSANRIQSYGIPGGAKNTGFRPYEVLVIASLVEKEGLEKDFARVSRVIQNRLSIGMPVQLDSTINYELDKPTLETSADDRDSNSPYNTYKFPNLPPTPIGSPSKQAIEAAINPENGEWEYFVKCQKDGTSCFAKTFEEHQKLVDKAITEGVFGNN
ncbi:MULTISPECIES: endolytic transglycosylase MltG [Actinosynnema]|uniref:Endolytic murein transglycosylase n=1 Tax=Actinosynnema pretiosum TaxID=42197 RepID=A0A290ZBJ4_9PSEU|nr:endolytic transglycosylase MltG [Actinosynnema pretiosum]ATE56333.1 aminodeoxychorismate lyase [Actinosynnema pretiosum]